MKPDTILTQKSMKPNKYKAKHSSAVVQSMRKMAEEGYAIQYIARKFKCTPNGVFHRVYDVIPPRKATPVQQRKYLKRSKLTVTKVKRIRKLGVQEKINAVAVGKIYGISQTTALSIINGKTFRWIPGMTKIGYINPIDYKQNVITDRTRGQKVGIKKKVKTGVLIKYAKRHNVSTSTICKWIKKGKLKIRKNEYMEKPLEKS